MLSMVGMTAVTMIVLGLTLTSLSSSFLIGQAQHKGVELAKMAAQVGRSVIESGPADPTLREERLKRYFGQATTWGESEGKFSDIIGITFNKGQFSQMTWGEVIEERTTGQRISSINLPRLGWTRLTDEIIVSETRRNNLPVFPLPREYEWPRRRLPGE